VDGNAGIKKWRLVVICVSEKCEMMLAGGVVRADVHGHRDFGLQGQCVPCARYEPGVVLWM
jgi:hypothetical protein